MPKDYTFFSLFHVGQTNIKKLANLLKLTEIIKIESGILNLNTAMLNIAIITSIYNQKNINNYRIYKIPSLK